MKLIVKLVGGFSIVALIALAVGLVGVAAIRQLNGRVLELGGNRLPSVESLLIISEAQTAVDSGENALLASDIDAQRRAEVYEHFDAAQKRAGEARKVYEPLPQTAEEADDVEATAPRLGRVVEGSPRSRTAREGIRGESHPGRVQSVERLRSSDHHSVIREGRKPDQQAGRHQRQGRGPDLATRLKPKGRFSRSSRSWPLPPGSVIAIILGLVIAFQVRRQLGTEPSIMAEIAREGCRGRPDCRPVEQEEGSRRVCRHEDHGRKAAGHGGHRPGKRRAGCFLERADHRQRPEAGRRRPEPGVHPGGNQRVRGRAHRVRRTGRRARPGAGRGGRTGHRVHVAGAECHCRGVGQPAEHCRDRHPVGAEGSRRSQRGPEGGGRHQPDRRKLRRRSAA